MPPKSYGTPVPVALRQWRSLKINAQHVILCFTRSKEARTDRVRRILTLTLLESYGTPRPGAYGAGTVSDCRDYGICSLQLGGPADGQVGAGLAIDAQESLRHHLRGGSSGNGTCLNSLRRAWGRNWTESVLYSSAGADGATRLAA